MTLRVAGATVIEMDAESDAAPVSATRIINIEDPGAVGVPLICPAGLSDKPAGSVPEAIDQVYGGIPPLACKLCEYGVPTVPFGKFAVTIFKGGGVITSLSVCVSAPPFVSVTLAVKFAIVVVAAVPAIWPVEFNVNPAGKLPLAIDQA